MGNVDTLDSLRELTQKQPKKREFGKALAVSPTQVQSVAGKGKSVMHGRYKQVLVRLLPEDADRLDAAAQELGLNKEDTKRWLILRGLRAFDEGERPEMETVEVKRLKRP